jgi:hypothetical protein
MNLYSRTFVSVLEANYNQALSAGNRNNKITKNTVFYIGKKNRLTEFNLKYNSQVYLEI